MHTTMVPVQVKTMKIQAGVQVSRPGELRRHLQLWKRFGRLYSPLSKATPTATPGLADEVIHSFLATNADDVDLIHEDLDQIDDLDLEERPYNLQIAIHKP
ncbi:hypothetical protein Tco_1056783 [Tanacetum coccineum]|uniref:Uncharacterized protein n=1 Tax=Tanacetum coccineum TaxID=301880 RepID=A0ABQ5H3P7_9ASTR